MNWAIRLKRLLYTIQPPVDMQSMYAKLQPIIVHFINLANPLLNKMWQVKVHTLDIAPLRSETPPRTRSGMARVLKGSHVFNLHIHTFIRNRNEPYLPLPSLPQLVLIYRPRWEEGWVNLGAKYPRPRFPEPPDCKSGTLPHSHYALDRLWI